MKKVLLISTAGIEEKIITFVKDLNKKIYFDDLILCNAGNREKMAFVNEQLALPAVFEIEQNYGSALSEGVRIVQKKYSNENVVIVILCDIFDGSAELIKKFIQQVEEEGYDLVYLEEKEVEEKGKRKKEKAKRWWQFWKKAEDFEVSPLQAVRMRKLLQLKPETFGQKWKSDLIRMAEKSGFFVDAACL